MTGLWAIVCARAASTQGTRDATQHLLEGCLFLWGVGGIAEKVRDGQEEGEKKGVLICCPRLASLILFLTLASFTVCQFHPIPSLGET